METYELCVLLSECLVIRAFNELSADGAPELNPFPPADPRTPAAAALATAGSPRVAAAGIHVVLEEHSLANALSRIAVGPGSANPSTVPAFEQSLRLHLGKSIEASGSHLNDFADAVRFWEPEIVIAVDPSVIRRYAKERFVMRPSEWVRHCISIARTS